jgi:hypothetical protein
VAAVLIVAAFLGSRFFLGAASEPYRTVAALDVRAYLDNANSLRGNVYKIEGKVEESLAWSPSAGRLFAVSVGDGADVLPILITTKFNDLNVQKGQKFIFLLEVGDDGILRTKELTKA